MNDRQAFDTAIELIKCEFPRYLASQGIDTRKPFRCLNPDHMDKTPSAKLMPKDTRFVHCFSCNSTYNIFHAVAWKEGKPSFGRGWMTDTVMYLAEKFGIEMPDMEISDDDLREMQIIGAYQHAMQIVRNTKRNEMSAGVQAKLEMYRWPNDVLYKLGIGSVVSFDDYMHRMTVTYGHTVAFLEEIDLAHRGIFNENALIFTIRETNGMPVAFSSRDVQFEEKKAAYVAAVEKGETPKFKARKFVHTANNGSEVNGIVKRTLFNKSSLLFNFDLAMTGTGALVVFEGNADCVTAFAGGIHTATAVLGSAITREHLELAMRMGKKHVVFVLDPDKAGREATARVMALVEECSGLVGLRVEVISLPGTKDPDAFIRSFDTLQRGVQEFRKLPRIDMFTWRLQQALDNGEDPITVCENTIPFIVNEQSNILRMKQAGQLAAVTNTSRDFVEREVLRLIDKDIMRLEEDKAVVASDIAKELRSNPKNAVGILAKGQARLENLDKRNILFDLPSILKTVDTIFDDKEKNDTAFELRTGFPLFDQIFGGIPRRGALFCLPGKPHHGKSIVVDNLINGLLDNNPEVMVLLHTIDDYVPMRIDRILGARTGLASDCFRRPGYYLNDSEGQLLAPEGFADIYHEAKAWYRGMHEECRLIAADPSMLVSDVMGLKSWVQELRRMFPERTLVVIGDNFHLYTMETPDIGEAKIRGISRYINDQIVNTLGTTVFMTMEIPKEQLRPGLRPTYLNLKGSAGLSFDAKVNIGVYNQLQDFSESMDRQSELYWQSPDHMIEQINGDGIRSMVQRQLPIVECIVDKNKVSGTKGTVYFRLEDKSGRMSECTDVEQQTYRSKAIASEAAAKNDRNQLDRTRQPFKRGTI